MQFMELFLDTPHVTALPQIAHLIAKTYVLLSVFCYYSLLRNCIHQWKGRPLTTEVSDLRSRNTKVFFDSNLIVASLSLGGMLLVSEAERLPTLSYIAYQNEQSLLGSILGALFFGALLVGKYFKSSTKRTPPVLIMLLAIVLSGALIGVLAPAGVLPPEVCVLCDIAHSLFWPVFLYAWIREVLPLGYSYTMQSFALGLIVLGALNLLSMAMNTIVSIVVIALMPLISGALLICVKAPERSYEPEAHFAHTQEATSKRHILIALFTIIPLACFAIVFGNVHQSWNALQDGSGMSLIVQLGVAAGTLLAGLGVYGLYAIGTLRKYSSIVMLILIAFTLFSIWLSTYTNGNLVFLYAAFLNIAQKGVFLLIFLAPFKGPWQDPLFGWCASMCAFLYGTIISSILMSFHAEMILVAFAVIALCLLMVCAVATLVNDIEGSKFSSTLNEPTDQSEAAQAIDPEPNRTRTHQLLSTESSATATNDDTRAETEITADKSAETEPFNKNESEPSVPSTDSTEPSESTFPAHHSKDEEYVAYMRLVQEFTLTRREADVLSLLVHGRTAEPIAKTLGISPATAKTHIRNVYTKLNVHTQQEVIDLLEAYLHR